MKYFNTLLAFCLICLHLTGCVIEAPQQEKDPDITPSECNLDPTLCSGSERCLLIDPCGSACGDDLDAPCPDVCIEIYACVSPLKPGDECDLAVDQCGDGFVCRPDWDAPCEPSFCDGYTCTADCREINTCQARQVSECDPADPFVCGRGEVCRQTGTHYDNPCGGNEPCMAIPEEPEPIFSCIPSLREGERCGGPRVHEDACQTGLICAIDEALGCESSCPVCDDCNPIFTCQAPATPTTCDELDCGPGYECVHEVPEGCGYADPEVQRECESQQVVPICVPLEVEPGCDPSQLNACGYGEVCVPSEEFICPECDGYDNCPDIPCEPVFHCVAKTCEHLLCETGSECQMIPETNCTEDHCDDGGYLMPQCVGVPRHQIGPSCEETMCAPDYDCVETWTYLPCDGPGCGEPDVDVTCEQREMPDMPLIGTDG